MQKKDFLISFASFIIVIFLTIGYIIRGILVDKEKAIKVLEYQGYTQVRIVDKSWFLVGWRGCSDGDAVRFTAEASNPVGLKVKVYVCMGIIKGGTIRVK